MSKTKTRKDYDKAFKIEALERFELLGNIDHVEMRRAMFIHLWPDNLRRDWDKDSPPGPQTELNLAKGL